MRHYSHEPSFASPILTPLDLMVWVVACGGGGCASNDTMSVAFMGLGEEYSAKKKKKNLTICGGFNYHKL